MVEIPTSMHAVVLTGHGGPEMLEYRDDVAVPRPAGNEVLIRIGACGVNNTDINTRIGWYSKSVSGSTDDATDMSDDDGEKDDDGGWSGGLVFPRIQGADAAGTIVAVGTEVDASRIGDRVMVRTMQDRPGHAAPVADVFGSELDGGFAQYCTVRSDEAFTVTSSLTDIELASFPCAYSTAEGMIHKVAEYRRSIGFTLGDSDRAIITGASGGVGSAAIQLLKRRGVEVVAIASQAKWDSLEPFGPDTLVDRNTDLVAELGSDSFDAVFDVVAGPAWPSLLDVLKLGGTYMTAGAIAGPMVELDVRSLYLKDLTLMGSTWQPRVVFENLVNYVEAGEIRPIVSQTYPLADIAEAQEDFLSKRYAGKLVLVPPAT